MKRIAVSLPTALVKQVDRVIGSRSGFIAVAVERELARRRRDVLLLSVQNPHPETIVLIDVGLNDWVSEMPGDHALVDASAGTPVRWIQGKGWTKQ